MLPGSDDVGAYVVHGTDVSFGAAAGSPTVPLVPAHGRASYRKKPRQITGYVPVSVLESIDDTVSIPKGKLVDKLDDVGDVGFPGVLLFDGKPESGCKELVKGGERNKRPIAAELDNDAKQLAIKLQMKCLGMDLLKLQQDGVIQRWRERVKGHWMTRRVREWLV